MVFSSITFLYFFLPAVLILYVLVPKKYKNIILLAAGLLFYSWGEPAYFWVMIVSSLVDYAAGIYMTKTESTGKRRAALIVSMVADLGFLFVFKYSGFAVDVINKAFGTNIPRPDLPLPIGISFYTFQSMSYTIDIYRRQTKVQKNFINYLTYVSLFPQLVAGPIVRYNEVADSIDERTVTADKFGEGTALFIKGLAKKVLIANNIGALWTEIKGMDYAGLSALSAWLGILAFTYQIYFDFSGYSDMARGLGKMFGFEFPVNFDHPYQSKSVTEFWRRWHITLGSWFREYLYIPLGGNRHGTARTFFNLAVVWILTGFWHGASFNFILWGAFYGFLIIIERAGFSKVLEKMPTILSTLYTFIVTVIGWAMFDLDTAGDFLHYLKAMFAAKKLVDPLSVYQLTSFGIIFAVCIFASADWRKKIFDRISDNEKYGKVLAAVSPAVQLILLVFSTCYLVDATYNPFLYFRF
ncbi:MBOAT family O-acyltransferase [Ruminococcus sp. HUN007]|uniref:MBOAT family O-acyltransferase n=1 Tax=Ruminococcus sp. HUN007 TaxID=1514668 RepID=UPI0005D24267|nr:MBOAT family O-acyltransferase [Ruminococcus sp. HUN007]